MSKTTNKSQNKTHSKQPQHVRVYLGAHGINIKESANPSFKTTDGDFIRRGIAANQSKELIEVGGSHIEAANENFRNIHKNFKMTEQALDVTQQNFIKLGEIVKDLEIRLEKIEQLMNDVVYPSHRKLPPENTVEKVKKGVKVKESVEPVEIPRDEKLAQKIRRMEEESAQRRRW